MNGLGLISLILFIFVSFYLYQQQQIETFKKTAIPKMEKALNASYHAKSYLDKQTLNSLKIFKHNITDIESFGYFQNDTKVIEYLKILFVKQDTEEGDIVNTLFDGKVIIEEGNSLKFERKNEEYFEAGEILTHKKEINYGKEYTFIDGEKLY